jgi:hypothetical protein
LKNVVLDDGKTNRASKITSITNIRLIPLSNLEITMSNQVRTKVDGKEKKIVSFKVGTKTNIRLQGSQKRLAWLILATHRHPSNLQQGFQQE